MTFTLEKLKEDLITLDTNQIYEKYINNKECWYFEDNKDGFELLKNIISKNMGIEFNDITIVGSAKIGYSLSPKNELRQFREGSDIDIVIISNKWFQYFWKLYRKSYKPIYNVQYQKNIYRETFLGFIQEKNLSYISGCRKSWRDLIAKTKNYIHSSLFLQHEINIRIYRNWQDFKEYNIWSINKLKGEINEV